MDGAGPFLEQDVPSHPLVHRIFAVEIEVCVEQEFDSVVGHIGLADRPTELVVDQSQILH
jgi:hypothetical protein